MAKKSTNQILKQLQDKAPELVKNNKGAVIGAVIGYLLSEKLDDHKEVQNTILGALAGAFLEGKKSDF